MSNGDFTTFGAVPAYSNPLPVPSVDPDAAITKCVEFNAEFLPYILGCLAPLLLPEAWDTDDVSEKLLAIARIDHLRYLLMNPELCTSSSLCLTLAQIMIDAEGNLALFVAGLLAAVLASCGEYLKDQLAAIISLDAIMNFFFGSTADYAEFATVLPEYGVDIVPISFQVDGCNFQMSIDGGENWVTQFAFNLESCPALQGEAGQNGTTGAQGPQGETGAQGPQGETGARGGGATVLPIDKGTNPNVCAGAGGIVEWANGLLSAALSKIDESAAGFAVAAAVMGETIIGDFLLNDLLNAIAGFMVLGTTAINADHDSQADQDMTCAFFCAFKELAGGVAPADILDVAQTLSESSNLWLAAIGALILSGAGAEFLAAYNAQATNEDNSCAASCTDCPEEWEQIFDFTASAGISEATNWIGHESLGTRGSWVSGEGWEGEFDQNLNTLAFIFVPFTSHITAIVMHAYSNYATVGSDSAAAFFNREAGVSDTQIGNNYDLVYGEQEFDWNGDVDVVDGITLHMRQYGNRASRIRSVTIYGTGQNPF